MERSIDEAVEPDDEAIDPRERRRPPGGKALLRLQQHLEERGLVEVAQASVERAVADERRSEFDVRARAFSAAPTLSIVCLAWPSNVSGSLPSGPMPI